MHFLLWRSPWSVSQLYIVWACSSQHHSLEVMGHLKKSHLGHSFCNFDKYILQCGQIQFVIWKYTFCNLDKLSHSDITFGNYNCKFGDIANGNANVVWRCHIDMYRKGGRIIYVQHIYVVLSALIKKEIRCLQLRLLYTSGPNKVAFDDGWKRFCLSGHFPFYMFWELTSDQSTDLILNFFGKVFVNIWIDLTLIL